MRVLLTVVFLFSPAMLQSTEFPLLSRPRTSVAVAAEYHISFSSIRSRIMHKLTQFKMYMTGGVCVMCMHVPQFMLKYVDVYSSGISHLRMSSHSMPAREQYPDTNVSLYRTSLSESISVVDML